MSRFAAFALSVIVSCSPIPQEAPPSRAVALTQALPPMQMFSTSYVAPATRPNSEIAQDFLDLSFRMESGRAVANMTRFDGPITVRATGDVNATMLHDLQALLA
ncbi:MAG: ATP-dependent transcriptional regulator, partial [Loktanella sp.]|nr:ATP-dependent transcriptional regulator [Loktanella sp.]